MFSNRWNRNTARARGKVEDHLDGARIFLPPDHDPLGRHIVRHLERFLISFMKGVESDLSAAVPADQHIARDREQIAFDIVDRRIQLDCLQSHEDILHQVIDISVMGTAAEKTSQSRTIARHPRREVALRFRRRPVQTGVRHVDRRTNVGPESSCALPLSGGTKPPFTCPDARYRQQGGRDARFNRPEFFRQAIVAARKLRFCRKNATVSRTCDSI